MNEPKPELDKNTCWDSEAVIEEMNAFFDKHRYNPETSQHFTTFKKLLNEVPLTYLGTRPTLLDIGCGTGLIQDHIEAPWTYIGCDQEAIVTGCLFRNYPKTKGFPINVFSGERMPITINLYRLCVINGVLDISQFPMEFLKKLLYAIRDYLIIHRQEITEEGQTRSIQKPSYGGYTYHSIINRNDFNQLLSDMDFEIVREEKLDCGFPWENGGSSFLLKRKQ